MTTPCGWSLFSKLGPPPRSAPSDVPPPAPFPSRHTALGAPSILPSQVDGCLGHFSLCVFKHLPFLLKWSK